MTIGGTSGELYHASEDRVAADEESSVASKGLLFCLFFFQAEDGIRDVAVTGVQTCALPILSVCVILVLAFFAAPEAKASSVAGSSAASTTRNRALVAAINSVRALHLLPKLSVDRSEERRVGKEGRSGWSGDPEREERWVDVE